MQNNPTSYHNITSIKNLKIIPSFYLLVEGGEKVKGITPIRFFICILKDINSQYKHFEV